MTIAIPLTTRSRSGHHARLRRATVALSAVLAVSALQAPRAEAVEVTTLIAAAKTAYSAYQSYQANKLTLAQATDQIIDAIGSAKTQIIAHMDKLAAADGRACAKAAVIDLENIELFTPTVAQQYARDTVACLTLIDSRLDAVTDKAAIDQLGFSLNGLGPIVLLSHARVGFSTTGVRSTLIGANQTVISRLYPSCGYTALYGDAEPGGMVEVSLRCRAYNGDVGYDTAFTTNPKTTTYNYTYAANTATRNTSRAVAQAVLPKL